MEKILDSMGYGRYMRGATGFDVYAEVCEKYHIGGSTFLARVVECPDDLPDKVAFQVDGLGSKAMAETALESLVASYRRTSGLF